MLSEKSLRVRFILQLASASMMLVAIITVMLYYYIRVTIYESVVQELKFNAEILTKQAELGPPMAGHFTLSTLSDGSTDVEIITGVLEIGRAHV